MLLLCGRDPQAAPRRHWTPWLVRLSPEQVEDARSTAARVLLARGLAHRDDDGPLQLEEPLTTLAHALDGATDVVTVDSQVVGEPFLRAGLLHLPGGVVLHDDIDHDRGLHRLVLRDTDRACAWLAAFLDPTGAATTAGDPVTGPSLDVLVSSPSALPGRVVSRAAAASGTTSDGGRVHAVTTIGTSDGCWLLQERADEEPRASVQRLDAQGVRDIAVRLLLGPESHAT